MDPLPTSAKIDWKAIEERVFRKDEKTGVLSIGGKPIDPQLRDILREQAKYFGSSNLREILDATIRAEAADMALIQSEDFDHVNIAKMLHHWNFVLQNMIVTLVK